MTRHPEPGRPDTWSYRLVTDPGVIEALQQLRPWRTAGDSADWELAVFAYDVPADTSVMGVLVPAGLYTREVTRDGRHVIAHRWNDHQELAERLDDVERRHHLFVHIAHADARFVAAHTEAIHAAANQALALIERDEREGGPLYDASIRCWHDLSRYVDDRAYAEELPRTMASNRDEDLFVTAVHDRVDMLLHHRDRLLSVDEAEAAGFDGTLRDGNPPATWATLTARQRAALDLRSEMDGGPSGPAGP